MGRCAIGTLVVAAVLTASSPASAAVRLRAYRGQTSAGTRIAFVIRIADDGRMSMKELHLQVEMTCDDAATFAYGSVWWFGGVGPRFDGRRLTYDAVYGPEATHITGGFRATRRTELSRPSKRG